MHFKVAISRLGNYGQEFPGYISVFTNLHTITLYTISVFYLQMASSSAESLLLATCGVVS